MGRWVKQKFKDQKKKTKNSREKWGKDMDCPKTHKYKWVIYEIMCNCIIIKYKMPLFIYQHVRTYSNIIFHFMEEEKDSERLSDLSQITQLLSIQLKLRLAWYSPHPLQLSHMIELFFFYFGSSNVPDFSSFQTLTVCNTTPTLSHCPQCLTTIFSLNFDLIILP